MSPTMDLYLYADKQAKGGPPEADDNAVQMESSVKKESTDNKGCNVVTGLNDAPHTPPLRCHAQGIVQWPRGWRS